MRWFYLAIVIVFVAALIVFVFQNTQSVDIASSSMSASSTPHFRFSRREGCVRHPESIEVELGVRSYFVNSATQGPFCDSRPLAYLPVAILNAL